MSHGHELQGVIAGGNEEYQVKGGKGDKILDNCNSIIREIYLLKCTFNILHPLEIENGYPI